MNSVLHFSPVVSALAWALLHFIWQGCVLAAAFALAMLVLRRASASARYLAGCATLLMMAFTPIATLLWQYRTNLPPMWVDEKSAMALRPLAAVGSSFDRAHLVIVSIWMLGVIACVIWVVGGWLNTRRYRRMESLPVPRDLQYRIAKLAEKMHVRCVVRVIDHLAIVAPLTLGAIKPVILLPASMLTGLSRAQLQAIIAHEMAHVRRMDFLVNLLQAALEAALFYHPAVWWVSRQVRLEREYCCDDLAAATCGNAITYARALAQLESLRSDGLRLGLSSQGGSLMKRIARMLKTEDSRARPVKSSGSNGAVWSAGLVGTSGAVFAVLIAASSAVALVKSPGPPPSEPVEVADQPAAHAGASALQEELWILAQDSNIPVAGDGEIHSPHVVELHLEWAGHHDVFAGKSVSQTIEFCGDVVSADHLLIEFGVSTIDPEHMPSEGLMQAAKLAYPFNLLQLMPWVAPEAHDVLIKPIVDGPSPTIVLHAIPAQHASTEVRLVPLLTDVPLIRTVAGSRLNATHHIQMIPALTVVRGVPAIDATKMQAKSANEIVTVELSPLLLHANDVDLELADTDGASASTTVNALPEKHFKPKP